MKTKRFGFLAIGSCAALSLTVGAVFANFFVQDDANEVKVQVRMATINHTVTFQTNGGSSIDSQEVEHNHYATRPQSNPTKDHYVFENWYEDSELQKKFDFEETPIVEDTTIYAKYNPNYDYDAEVGYRLVGTFGDDSNQYFKYSTAKPSNQSLDGNNVAIFHYELTEGTEFKLIHYNTARTASDATWYGYSELKSNFATEGYCRDFFEEGDSGNIVVKAGCTGDYTIYLDNSGKIWINRFYTVTYQDGNKELDTQTVQGGTATSKIADPNKDGYVFKKWCSDPELNNEFNFATLITSDIHLYAKFNQNYDYGAGNSIVLIGNFGANPDAYYTYSTSKPNTKAPESKNTAEFTGISLTAGQEVAVKDFGTPTVPTVYGYANVDLKNLVDEGTDGRIKILETGTYNFYYKVEGDVHTIYTRLAGDPSYRMVGSGGETMNNWKVNTGLTSSAPGGTNKAQFLNVSLKAGQEFRIVDVTTNSWNDPVFAKANPNFELDGENIRVRYGGVYDIYLNSNNDVSIDTVEGYFFVNLGGSGLWNKDNPDIYLYMWNDSTNNGAFPGEKMSVLTSDSNYRYFYVDFSKYKNFKLSRWKTNKEEKWNETGNLDFDLAKNLFTITSWDGGNAGTYSGVLG